jgi:hypothetical protein
MRFKLTTEDVKHGRRVETYYCLFDTYSMTVTARFGNPERVTELIDRYEAAQMAAEEKATV